MHGLTSRRRHQTSVVEPLEDRTLLSFAVGERVVTVGNTYCRPSASINAGYYGNGPIPANEYGTIRAVGINDGTYEWYRVDWDRYNFGGSDLDGDGWSAGGSRRFVTVTPSLPAHSGPTNGGTVDGPSVSFS